MSSVLPFHLPPSSTPLPPPHDPQPPTITTRRPPRSKPSIRTRLSQLCKDGRPDLARHLFDALRPPTPTVLWNTLLIGFVCNAMPSEALALYAQMNASHSSPPPDHYTFSSALKACALARQLRLGRSIHCRILRCLEKKPKNRVLSNSLLNMYASCLDLPTSNDLVHKVFDGMPKRNVVSWNTLISWYAKNSRPADALENFKAMLEIGIRPTPVSFVHVFPAAAAIGERTIADALHALLAKLGSVFVSDPFVVSSAISMYSELSDIESARQVFNSAAAKNIEVWNSMIGGYAENDLPEEAIDLFVQIFESNGDTQADTVTLVEALVAASQSQDVRFGRQIHAYAIKWKDSTSTSPVILSNALMAMYSRCGWIEDTSGIFHRMEERDVVSWNTMISSCVQNGMNLEGLHLVRRMQEEACRIDSVTVAALLSAASNLGDIRIGKETHAYLIRHGIECIGMSSYLIDMYSKSGSVKTASRLFDVDRPFNRDQVTWNAMIAGYSQSDQTYEAISVLRQMLVENVKPNAVTLASILPACGPIGGIRMGKQIHGYAIRHLLHENVFAATAVVDMYSKCGKVAFAERVFDGMDDRNSVTYTTMISGYGQHGLGDKALSLFRTMLESAVKPDSVTFVAIMAACSYMGLVEEGLEIFQSMEREYGIPATPEHHCCVVDMLGRAGRVEEAYELALELGDQGNNVGVWGSLLASCRIHGKFELGKVVAERMFRIEEEGGGQAGYHVLLSNVYAAQSRWENVDKLRKRMREKGLTKEPGSSWIEVGDRTHRFVSKDQNHPERNRVRTILEDLVAEMKLAGDTPTIDDHFDEEFEVLE